MHAIKLLGKQLKYFTNQMYTYLTNRVRIVPKNITVIGGSRKAIFFECLFSCNTFLALKLYVTNFKNNNVFLF